MGILLRLVNEDKDTRWNIFYEDSGDLQLAFPSVNTEVIYKFFLGVLQGEDIGCVCVLREWLSSATSKSVPMLLATSLLS